MASDFEERFNDLTQNKNVIGAMILTAEGKTVRTTFDTTTSSNYSEFAYKLLKSTRELLQVILCYDSKGFPFYEFWIFSGYGFRQRCQILPIDDQKVRDHGVAR